MWKGGLEVRQDMTVDVLRRKARAEKDGRVAARMLGIANILEGMDRTMAASAAGMDRQTLRDWVHRYNDEGVEGLRNRPKGRPRRALTPGQENEIAALVSEAPGGRLMRWRCADVKAAIEQRYGVILHERSVGKLLHRLGFRRMSVRPVHPASDPAAQAAFKKTSLIAWRKSSPRTPAAKASSSGSRMKPGSDKKPR
jgi:transposase